MIRFIHEVWRPDRADQSWGQIVLIGDVDDLGSVTGEVQFLELCSFTYSTMYDISVRLAVFHALSAGGSTCCTPQPAIGNRWCSFAG